MRSLGPLFSSLLALVLILQTTIIYLKLAHSGVEVMPARYSEAGLVRRQDDTEVPTYYGHLCTPTRTVDPIPAPGINHCEPNPDVKPMDAHEHRVLHVAEYFCSNDFDTILSTDQDGVSLPIQKNYLVTFIGDEDSVVEWTFPEHQQSDVYDVMIDWREGCTRDPHERAVSDVVCTKNMVTAWKSCNNNQGRGGTLELGCLNYSIVTKY